MKRERLGRKAAPPAAETFVRGFVAAGLLSALQDRVTNGSTTDWRRVVRHAIQGGAALTSATLAAEAITRRDYGIGAAAVAIGAATVMAAEATLNPTLMQEASLGQEEA